MDDSELGRAVERAGVPPVLADPPCLIVGNSTMETGVKSSDSARSRSRVASGFPGAPCGSVAASNRQPQVVEPARRGEPGAVGGLGGACGVVGGGMWHVIATSPGEKAAGGQKRVAPHPIPAGADDGACPMMSGAAAGGGAAASADELLNAANMMPLEARQKPSPGQRQPLSTARMQSTIPRAVVSDAPKHQPEAEGEDGGAKWVYPSHQMFYNAMKRKGWEATEQDMPFVVAIHNMVNETTWKEVLRWEAMHETYVGYCAYARPPVLTLWLEFPPDAQRVPVAEVGEAAGATERPQSKGAFLVVVWVSRAPLLVNHAHPLTAVRPRRLTVHVLGRYELPFDRHDWIVDRCGEKVRYVIDFYRGKPDPSRPFAFSVDVRPALDSPGAVFDRLRRAVSDLGSFAGPASADAPSAPLPPLPTDVEQAKATPR